MVKAWLDLRLRLDPLVIDFASESESSYLERDSPLFAWSILGPMRQEEVRSLFSESIRLGKYALITSLLISRVFAPIKTKS